MKHLKNTIKVFIVNLTKVENPKIMNQCLIYPTQTQFGLMKMLHC